MKVSVIIPAYNAQQWIGRCLESVLQQTYTDLEIIVLNDGSKDGTLQEIKKYTAQDSRLILIDKENSGTFLTRKAGIKRSVGDLILNLDADDYLEERAIEMLVFRLIEDKADLVIGNHYQVKNGNKRFMKN